jgi:sugar phosphate isomerase/epimerase
MVSAGMQAPDAAAAGITTMRVWRQAGRPAGAAGSPAEFGVQPGCMDHDDHQVRGMEEMMAQAESVADRRAISLSYLTVRGTAPWDQIECAHRCGYSHVGLRFHPVLDNEALVPVVGYPERMAAIERQLVGTGVKLLDIEFFWIKPDTNIREFLPYIEAGARLGARNLLVGANDPDKNRFVEHWLELCDLAAAHGLRAHLEFMPFPGMSSINSYADALALMKAAPHPNAAIMVDALHFFRGGGRVADILPEHHAYMADMQLCDAPGGQPSPAEMQRQAREDRLPPGRGELDLIGLLNALPAALPISVEAPVAATRAQPALERARLVFGATQDLLARCGHGSGQGIPSAP